MANEIAEDKPLATLAEFIRWFTTLALGGLAFGVGLQQFVADYVVAARTLLQYSWWAYGFAATVGIILQSAFPVLYEQKRLKVKSRWLQIPYYFFVAAFIAGSICLVFSLRAVFDEAVPPDKITVKDANEAVRYVRHQLPRQIHVIGVDAVEIIKGAQQSAIRYEVWHVRLSLHDDSRTRKKRDYKADIYIRAYGGEKTTVSP